MVDLKVLNERSLSISEVRDILNNKDKKELSARGVKTLSYIDGIIQCKDKKAVEMTEKLSKLDITRLKERHIKKIVDIMPKDLDTLRTIFSGENITLKQEDLQKILDTIKC